MLNREITYRQDSRLSIKIHRTYRVSREERLDYYYPSDGEYGRSNGDYGNPAYLGVPGRLPLVLDRNHDITVG